MKLSTPVTVLSGLGAVLAVPTTEQIARGLTSARIERRDASFRTNTTVLDTTWTGVTLLKQGLSSTSTNTTSLTTAGPPGPGVEITCESCYIKGGFTASLKVKDNSTDALTKYTNDVHDSVQTVTQTAFNQITDGLQASTPLNATSGDIETAPAQLPTVNVNFDLDLGPLPGVSAQFQFNEGLELYMLLNTKIAVGSTYIVNLFSSKTLLDVIIGSNITAGVALDIDLVLTSRDAVDLTSGFHLRLDKGASMEFDLFSSNVSNVAIPAGKFEFLPVTLVSPSATLTGALRIALAATFDYNTGDTVIGGSPIPFRAGLVSQVVANLAEFTTKVLTTPSSTNTTCIPLSETYNLAIGAASGATIALGPNAWGPSPASAIPLYQTTLTSACAARGTAPLSTPSTPASTPTIPDTTFTPDTTTTLTTTLTSTRTTTPVPLLAARQTLVPEDRVTTTLLTTLFYTGVSCLSPSTADINRLGCPASLQTSSVYASIATHVTVVAPGVVVPTFPASALPPAAVTGEASGVAFGDGVRGFVVAVEGGVVVASESESVSSTGSRVVPTATATATATATGVPMRPTATGAPAPTGGMEGGGQKTWLDGKTGGVGNRVVVGVGVGLGVPVLAGVVGGIVYLIRRRSYRRLGSRPGTPSQTVTNNNVYAVFAPPPARRKR